MDVLEGLVDTIASESGKPKDIVYGMIREKQDELSGLVSKEGAAYIVGRELGVSLIKETRTLLKASNLAPGLFSVDFLGRVMSIFEPRTFTREGRQGKVQNILLGDETGSIRMSLWNNETDMVQRLGLQQGMAVEVRGGYTKQDNMGNAELRLGRGLIKVAEGKELLTAEQITSGFERGGAVATDAAQSPARTAPYSGYSGSSGSRQSGRKGIAELSEGDVAEIRGMLVQLFVRTPFYEVCPTCGSRVSQLEGKWTCKDHGPVEPAYQLVVSGFIDDGDANIRAVFFREAAEKAMGRSADEVKRIVDEAKAVEAAFANVDSVGKELLFRGRVTRSAFSGSLEFVVGDIDDIDPKKEADAILKSLGR